jgi:hypothetical protein
MTSTSTESRPRSGYHAIAYEDDTYVVLADDTEPARVKVFVKEGRRLQPRPARRGYLQFSRASLDPVWMAR